ncbi:MAG: S41 family peptidase [Bacteroidota bacterium]
MKLTTCILIAILYSVLSVKPVSAQTNSDSQKKYYFFKVWGFLKYNHPAIASGKMDADSVFLSHLPAIEAAKNNTEFNNAVSNMLQQLGIVKKRPAPIKQPTAKVLTKNIDQSWFIKDKYLSKAICQTLQFIHQNRFAGALPYYYTEKSYGTDIPHEKPYAFADSVNIPYAYRMLTLAKMAATIDYLYPHKYLMDSNWDKDVKEFIPLFVNASTRIEHERLLLKLSALINDTHSFRFYKQMKNAKTILQTNLFPPFDFKLLNDKQILVTKVLVPELCQKTDIKAGDIITGFGKYSVQERVNELAGLISASNRSTLLHNLSIYTNNLLFTTDSLQSRITYQRNGVSKSAILQWAGQNELPTIIDYLKKKMKPDYEGSETDYVSPDIVRFKIGEIIRYSNSLPEGRFKEGMDSVFNIVSKSKGLIFDMRGYPQWGGFLNFVYQRFGQDNKFFAHYYKQDFDSFGRYILATDSSTYRRPGIYPGHHLYKGKVVIIVDGETLSLSEFQTMYLQGIFPDAITIGETSAGADGDEKMMTLPGGYEFNFTGNAIFYPNGTYAQRKGVRLDTVIHPLAADVLNNKDTILQAAINIINSKN